MSFDLGKALLRKEEFESGRWTEFEFTETVRALKALAADLGLHPVPLLDRMSEKGMGAALGLAAKLADMPESEVEGRYLRCRAIARAKLIEERGDPSPVRLG